MRRKFTVPVIVLFIVLVIIGILNVVPSIALTLRNVRIVGKVVDIATFHRYEDVQNVSFEVPEDLGDASFEEDLKTQFPDYADAVLEIYSEKIDSFRRENEKSSACLAVDSDFSVYAETDAILTLNIHTLYLSDVAAETHTLLNVDKESGKAILLSDLFDEGTDYVTPISDYIKTEMLRQNEEGEAAFFMEGDNAFSEIDKAQSYYLNEDGALVIFFDQYEVAPGGQGYPEFVIPEDVTNELWNEE